jgi:hypothetical protein
MDIPGMVAIDCNALIALCSPESDRRTKLEHVLQQLDKAKGKLLIPIPAVAEFLVHADQASLAVHDALLRKSAIRVGNFDLRAAHENALMDGAALGRGNKKDEVDAPWQKIKIDRQIVAIARAEGARLIISDDAGVRAAALRVGMSAMSVDEIPLPDSARQVPLELGPRNSR